MFKNRALLVQLAEKPKQQTTSGNTNPTLSLDPEEINQIAKEQVQNLGVVIGAVFAARVVLNTVSEIAIITAKAKIR